jgi:serine/threonine-protein kinase
MSDSSYPGRTAELRSGQARYAPKERIGVGGMADVWRGEAQFEDGQILPVAMKRVLPDLASSPLYRGILEDEARIGLLIRHPNVVRVLDARELHGSYVMIMELVEGASVRELCRDAQVRGMGLPLPIALHIARELARALVYLHEAVDEWGRELCIVHRDISPHNVLVAMDGSVKLIDFGLALSRANLREHDSSTLEGKLGYLAPEVVLRQDASPSVDLFAAGVILWECLAGQRLFQAQTDEETVRRVVRCQVPLLSELVEGVPAEVDDFLQVLLASDPGQRHATARDVAAELEYLVLRYECDWGKLDTASLMRTQYAKREATSGRVRTISSSGTQAVVIREHADQTPTRIADLTPTRIADQTPTRIANAAVPGQR